MPLQFGFTSDRQPVGALEANCTVVRNASEWGRRFFIASLDIAKAFDQLKAHSVERGVLEHQAPAWAVAAVLRGRRVPGARTMAIALTMSTSSGMFR